MSLIETAIGIAVPGAGVPLKIWDWCKSSATYLLAHPMTAVALLCATFGAVEHHEAGKWARVAQQRGAALVAFKTANDQAIKSATQAKETKDAENARLATVADKTASDLSGRYDAVVMRLARAQYSARRANLSGNANAAESSDGPGEGAIVPDLTVSGDDALTCADNTARLQAVHDWAVALGH